MTELLGRREMERLPAVKVPHLLTMVELVAVEAGAIENATLTGNVMRTTAGESQDGGERMMTKAAADFTKAGVRMERMIIYRNGGFITLTIYKYQRVGTELCN